MEGTNLAWTLNIGWPFKQSMVQFMVRTLDSSTLGLVQDTFPTHTSKWWPITPCTALKRVVISPLLLAHKMEQNPFQFKTMLMETKMATPQPETDGNFDIYTVRHSYHYKQFLHENWLILNQKLFNQVGHLNQIKSNIFNSISVN